MSARLKDLTDARILHVVETTAVANESSSDNNRDTKARQQRVRFFMASVPEITEKKFVNLFQFQAGRQLSAISD